MIAASLGASVIAVDINDDALELATRFGASAVINATGLDRPARLVTEMSGGGVDVSLDALGSTLTAVNSIRSLAKRGRHIQVGLMIGDDARPVIPMWLLHANEIELYGSHGMQAHRYPDMLAMVAAGTLRPEELITARMDLGSGIEHLMAMDSFPGTGFAVVNDFGA
jgi:alcohol dehydrogenase